LERGFFAACYQSAAVLKMLEGTLADQFQPLSLSEACPRGGLSGLFDMLPAV